MVLVVTALERFGDPAIAGVESIKTCIHQPNRKPPRQAGIDDHTPAAAGVWSYKLGPRPMHDGNPQNDQSPKTHATCQCKCSTATRHANAMPTQRDTPMHRAMPTQCTTPTQHAMPTCPGRDMRHHAKQGRGCIKWGCNHAERGRTPA
ncbi:hypothetical protein BS47DRAFT_1368730 [Hydnum rufescens UP504]|uniref:Uncharacterized protein n=1 Tax=Hydnum rufescens UP504 TaxID=1448309 RepID=A0A9P6DND5_9AGAM|nr:hypothetical protein BS47DRAFT_1368730 [Hydnum rufescens UP504]